MTTNEKEIYITAALSIGGFSELQTTQNIVWPVLTTNVQEIYITTALSTLGFSELQTTQNICDQCWLLMCKKST